MKWFKHATNAHDGKFVKHIFREFGLEGESRYWRLVGLLASKFPPDKKGFYTVSIETVRELLRHRSLNDCRSFLDHLATYQPPFDERSKTKELFLVEYSGNDCRIKYDKVSEIKDNHTTNLQANGKRLSRNLTLEEEKEKRKKKSKNDLTLSDSLNPVVIGAEIEKLLRTHPSDVDISAFASKGAKKVLSKYSRSFLGGTTAFEFNQLVREALKAAS